MKISISHLIFVISLVLDGHYSGVDHNICIGEEDIFKLGQIPWRPLELQDPFLGLDSALIDVYFHTVEFHLKIKLNIFINVNN